ncbi:hypothetical protein GCM10011587_02920 [Pyruvatibacter mobilis]|nr:hypothetical protein GCM10011587_02920 [Pyruvatibacter mobilis]
MYPAWGGRLSRLKGLMAQKFKQECIERELPASISVDPSDTLNGNDWCTFLGNCKFIIGAPGGHSVWDPYGVIQDSVNDYVAENPEASFEEIEQACFLGLDGLHEFPGFGPRIFEAAIMGCGQVLIENPYRGVIRPHEHYIPVAADMSNLDEAFTRMSDTGEVRAMIDRAYTHLVESQDFRISTMVKTVLDFFQSKAKLHKSPPLTREQQKATEAAHKQSLARETLRLGRSEERLEGEPLTNWANRVLSGQISDPEEVNMLVRQNKEL